MTTFAVHESKASQRFSALARANRIRVFRARLRRSVAEGSVDLGVVVRDHHGALLGTISIEKLLRWGPGLGPVRCRKILRRCGIAPNVKLRELTQRQRDELRAALAERQERAA